MKRALVLHERDTVATALESLSKGERISVGDHGATVTLKDDIQFEHKFALLDIPKGTKVYKYGAPIGIACRDIGAGQHVHLHNLKSRMIDGAERDEASLEEHWSNRIERGVR